MNRFLTTEIKRVFEDEKSRTGSPRIMRRNGLRAKAAKKFKAATNSGHSLPVAPNLLQPDSTVAVPNKKWGSDITSIWTEQGWLHLAVVLERYSRRIMGSAISERITATVVCDALMVALWRCQLLKSVIVHFGRASQ